MNDDHMNAFVSESRESITNLNNALLRLEDDPNDDEAIESVFRTAHTLKGNFGAMGFSNASELAHVLEDLLDEIRDGEIEVTPEIMDAAFDGVDRIETIVDEIEREGESTTNPDETTARLRAAIEDGEEGTTSDAGSSGEQTETDDTDTERDADVTFAHAEKQPVVEDADGLVHARIGVDPDGMLGVDAMLILEPISEAFDGIETAPARDAIEEGKYDGAFDVFVPGADPATVVETLESIGAVETSEVTDLGTEASTDSESDTEAAAEEVETAGEASGETADDEAGSGESDDADDETASDESGDAEGGDTSDESEKSDEETAEEGSDDASDDSDSDSSSRSSSTGGSDISSVRVDVDRLDELHGLVEQLVTGRITIRRAVENEDFETAQTSLNDFDKVTSRLQNTVMDMRLIPLRRVVSNLPRVVRDVARSQRKEISFEMYGQDIELDRSILTEIEDPLIHILRNAVDHGIEPPDEREAAGKPEEGTIELRASRERDHVTITVSDDGGGIDPDAMRSKAVDEGVISKSESESMPDDEAYDLIFHPGFSTASEVTDVSGRGVGMDVVHSTVEQLDGTVNVDSEPGEGTTVELRLPVSVAIVNVLFVEVGDQEYGIPIKNIDELTHATETETVNGEAVVRHNDDVYPVIRLEDALEIEDEPRVGTESPAVTESDSVVGAGGESTVATDGGPSNESVESDASGAGTEKLSDDDDGMLVRIRQSVRPVALRCDSFSDQEEVVVKPLEGSLSGIPGLSGTAILGDGNIVPILDVVSLEG
jgi:two-component system chemotaxis sensor kinase CheA